MRIAILGTRGIPGRYGGFETFAEELSAQMVTLGHEVDVFGRRYFGEQYNGPTEHRGAGIKILPTARHKYLETPLHSLLSFLYLFFVPRYDAVLLCNAANSPFAWLVRLRFTPLFINVDGIERLRTKWNRLGRWWYRLGELCSVLFATRVVSDARVIADYYKERYRCDSEVISYGAVNQPVAPGPTLKEFGLQKDNYILYVSRLEPENNALGVIQAYKKVSTDHPLVIVGDAPYASEYKEHLYREAKGAKVIFTGFQFEEAYRELRTNCLLYIQATEVGGTHPALVEGMAFGNCVVANDTPEHREVLGDAGIYYGKNDFSDLADKLTSLLSRADEIKSLGELAEQRANLYYTWDEVCRRYEELFSQYGSISKVARNAQRCN